ncbi:MAG: hypothetical protein Q9160_000112 [Pyrenula sp. 1 TL-2023]
MPMTWDDAAKAKLFAAVLSTSSTTPNYAAIAEIMGNECTVKAVTHQITNIKNKAKTDGMVTPGNGDENGKSPATPSRRGRPKNASMAERGLSVKTTISRGKKNGTPTSGRKRKVKEDIKEQVKQEASDNEAKNMDDISDVAEESDDSPSPTAKKAKLEANGPVVKEE